MGRSHVLRGRLGPMVRDDAPPEEIERVKQELKVETAAEYIRRLDESRPVLTETQRAKLAAILLGARRPDEAAIA